MRAHEILSTIRAICSVVPVDVETHELGLDSNSGPYAGRPEQQRALMKRAIYLASVYLGCAVVLFFTLLPVLWMLGTSLKRPVDYGAYPPQIIPAHPTFQSYRNAFQQYHAAIYLRNTVLVAFGATALACCAGTLGAYSLVRFRYRGRETIAFAILALRMFPIAAIAIPFFVVMNALHLLNTYWVLILAYQLLLLPFLVWMMRGFFEDLPVDLEECALVDGATRMRAFLRIALPLTAPGLAAGAVFCLMLSWNEFLSPLLFTQSTAVQPVSMLLANLINPSVGIQWGELSAVGIIGILPMLLFTFLMQNYLLRGLTMGAVKG
ncbi:MAG: carbohydrate ABC transporter permease [Chloroflexota bacterium]|nr:carbohydrate ABC transporter permease [Chloroflexota bacterium]